MVVIFVLCDVGDILASYRLCLVPYGIQRVHPVRRLGMAGTIRIAAPCLGDKRRRAVLNVWDTAQAEPMASFEAEGPIQCLCFDSEGSRLAWAHHVSRSYIRIRILSLCHSVPVPSLSFMFTSPLALMAFTSKGDRLVGIANLVTTTVFVWDASTGALLSAVDEARDMSAPRICFAMMNDHVLFAHKGGGVNVIDAGSASCPKEASFTHCNGSHAGALSGAKSLARCALVFWNESIHVRDYLTAQQVNIDISTYPVTYTVDVGFGEQDSVILYCYGGGFVVFDIATVTKIFDKCFTADLLCHRYLPGCNMVASFREGRPNDIHLFDVADGLDRSHITSAVPIAADLLSSTTYSWAVLK
jgi:WD40 repeat protein